MAIRGKGKCYQWLLDNQGHDGDHCLIWPFYRNPNGYGQFGHLGEGYWAHRFMCGLVNGPPPTPKHEAAHSCGNGKHGCAHPKHVSWKTTSENLLDCRQHGTQRRSRRATEGRLTAEMVLQIRALKGHKTQSEIAIAFGVSDPTIRDIFLGRSHARPPKVNFYTPDEDLKIRDAISRGCNFAEIGRLVGRSSQAVSGRAYRLGLKSGQPAQSRDPGQPPPQ
jgi:hypothetical protein